MSVEQETTETTIELPQFSPTELYQQRLEQYAKAAKDAEQRAAGLESLLESANRAASLANIDLYHALALLDRVDALLKPPRFAGCHHPVNEFLRDLDQFLNGYE